jgi:glycosyltransferase involved in cell wall biosynthesis
MERKLDSQKLRIMQIAPFDLPTRKDLMCGGTQRVVSSLDSSYTDKNHESFVVATADSQVEGTLLPTIKEPLWEYDRVVDPVKKEKARKEHYAKTLEHILRINPDVVHDQARFVCSDIYKERGGEIKCPIVVSIHSNFVSESEIGHLRDDRNIWVVALSSNHRENLEKYGLDMKGFVYNSVDLDDYPFEENKGDYLFSIGRIVPDKGQDVAIRVARKARKGLVIAGKVLPCNEANNKWWNEKVLNEVDECYKIRNLSMIEGLRRNLGQKIVWVNGLRDDQKKEFYKYASCLILPTTSEACNLSVIESLASGTPVIASNVASLPEQVVSGENGYLTNNEDEMVEAVEKLGSISSLKCRETVENRFSLEKQVGEYLQVYYDAIRNY